MALKFSLMVDLKYIPEFGENNSCSGTHPGWEKTDWQVPIAVIAHKWAVAQGYTGFRSIFILNDLNFVKKTIRLKFDDTASLIDTQK